MLPKENRLPLKFRFKDLQASGKIITSKLFSFIFRITNENFSPKFAFIVSKKIDKRAVVRNRVKRILSEAVRQKLPMIRQGVEGVIITKKNIVGVGYGQIVLEVEEIFGKADFL